MSALRHRRADLRIVPSQAQTPARSPRADQALPWLVPLLVVLLFGWLAVVGLITVTGWIRTWLVG